MIQTFAPVKEKPVTCNEANVRLMVDGIVNDPQSWNMNRWAGTTECGTTYCAAGLTVVQHGYELVNFDTEIGKTGYTSSTSECKSPQGEYKYIRNAASQILGLSYREQDDIFLYTSVEGKHPTVEEFVQRVADVTGITFKISTEILI